MLALALSGLTSPARAQEERGQLWDVQTISVRPDHIDEFMEAAELLKAAAEAAKLPAAYGWHMWIKGFDVAIASMAPDMASFDDPAFAQRHDFWVKPGMTEKFEKVAKDIIAFQAELGGPYPVNGYRIHFGDTGRVTFLVFNDGWGDFYGKNDMEALMEATGTTAKWEAIMTELRDCITGYEESQMEYIADLSYPGPGM